MCQIFFLFSEYLALIACEIVGFVERCALGKFLELSER